MRTLIRIRRVTGKCKLMRTNLLRCIAGVLLVAAGPIEVAAQMDLSSSFVLNRGKLWQTYGYGKSGPPYSDWTSRGTCLDWPGFDASLINENIGGSASYMVTGGLIVGAKWSPDSVIAVDDWSMYATSIAVGANSKYVVTTNTDLFPNGGNYWVKSNAHAGEQAYKTVWEYNVNYTDNNVEAYKFMLPIRVTRTIHQWSGSKVDENYVILDYVIKNISKEIRAVVPSGRFVADTLYDFYAMTNYGLHANSRAWNVLFPTLTPGARNTLFRYDVPRRVMYGYAQDEPSLGARAMGFAETMGPIVNGQPTGEFLAPGIVGISLLYSSRDNTGLSNHVVQYGWSAGTNTQDTGPFTNVPALPDPKYQVLKDLRRTFNYVSSSLDTLFMKKSRMWSLMTMGPWKILPGDSIRIVLAEIVDGIDYARAIDTSATALSIFQGSKRAFDATVYRAQFTFDNNFSHPNPPAAPPFSVDYNRTGTSVANVLKWGTDAESIPDAYDGSTSLAGYIVYRSGYLPIGPWIAIDTVTKGDPAFLSSSAYTFVDSTVDIGKGYFYALTAFNTGRTSWSGPRPPLASDLLPMETSIFANRTRMPFIATLPPEKGLDRVLVVPNPFVIGTGFSQPGGTNVIQFVNLPNPCTIRIYTVRGDLVKTLQVGDGAGAIVSWDQVTDFGQFVKSGVYVYHIDSPYGTKIGKLAIVR